MNGFLLDVNLLITLLDHDHIHHELAVTWLRNNGQSGWASCPITQNGCIRIMSNPSYSSQIFLSVGDVADKLREVTLTPSHTFIPDNVNLLDSDNIDLGNIQKPKDITDVYLLALAMHNNYQFATLDRKVNKRALRSFSDAALVTVE